MSGGTCGACGAALPSAFPGATIACACGQQVEVRGSASVHGARDAQSDGGPYRSTQAAHEPPSGSLCPYCGNACPPMVRICPHCDVRLESVRCQRCFTIHAPGSFACSRCQTPLELEPLLDATDAPCPRCHHPLEVAPGEYARAHECPRCGGLFVPRDALAEILVAAELGGALREVAPPRDSSEVGGWSVGDGEAGDSMAVRYVSCPQCHHSMNRVNFGKVSGIIVDVCKAHGTWFDAGELTRVVAFAASGGFERTRAREALESGDARARERESVRRTKDAHLAIIATDHRGQSARHDLWRDYLLEIFKW